ncbi:DNA integrity scanning protein DisA [Candidatus Woesearchaeota archaeon CG10_big_fil_rev_8_21_14_0_10_34_12]|nr:MAG: DNA integrity scanning protein DisA [Candidatus Woesearchaeota archaeon CG10_big_fil_rev_8_21_14_0_10_34_12]
MADENNSLMEKELNKDIYEKNEEQQTLVEKKEIDLPLVQITEKEKVIVIPKKENYDIIDALKLVSPGTQLRDAMEDIARARKGALIVLELTSLSDVVEGGLKLNCKFTPQRLFELSKMDGAVILSEDLKKIIYANCLLVPSPLIPTNETGTRHKAAERTARQTKTLVIAISERRNAITLYYYNLKYSLRKTEEILNRAMEKLQVLDKQREIYNSLIESLDTFEVTGLASTSNVASVLQRTEIMIRISETIKRDIIELGNEGNLVKIRFKELIKNIEKDSRLVIRDYLDSDRYYKDISKMNFDNLLDLQKVLEIIFGKKEEEIIRPRGYRLFDRLDFPKKDVEIVIDKFSNLDEIFSATLDDFEKIFRDRETAKFFMEEISGLKDRIIIGKRL